ncbi:hypothetical protein EHM76_02425 [bacterium]|nr:MAG: hypothetical protein EHM76_02425 [bacterium]
MSEDKEYANILEYLYNKNLVLHDTGMFHPVLKFYFIDALAHIDYTLGLMTYSYTSPRNIMSGEYLRWRIDEEKKGDRAYFSRFINWLKTAHPERFERLPFLWQAIYEETSKASYRSFRIVLDPDQTSPLPPSFFAKAVDEFFNNEFLKSLYSDASLSLLFEEFRRDVITTGK